MGKVALKIWLLVFWYISLFSLSVRIFSPCIVKSQWNYVCESIWCNIFLVLFLSQPFFPFLLSLPFCSQIRRQVDCGSLGQVLRLVKFDFHSPFCASFLFCPFASPSLFLAKIGLPYVSIFSMLPVYLDQGPQIGSQKATFSHRQT